VFRVDASDHDDLGHGLQLGREPGQVIEEIRTDKEDLGLGIVDDLGHLRCGQPPVDGHVHRIELAAGVQHVEVGEAVLVDEGQPVSRSDALGRERLGQPIRALVALPPRARLGFGRTGGVDEHDLVRRLRGPSPQRPHHRPHQRKRPPPARARGPGRAYAVHLAAVRWSRGRR